jgi:hypothetical protein
MKRYFLLAVLLSVGCAAREPVNTVPAAAVFRPIEDVALAKRQAAAQNKPLVVLSVLGDYKKHC